MRMRGRLMPVLSAVEGLAGRVWIAKLPLPPKPPMPDPPPLAMPPCVRVRAR